MGLHSRFRDGSRLLALFSALAIFQAKQSHREAKTERSEVNSPSRSLEAGQRMRPEGLRCDGAAEETRTLDIQLGKLTLYQLSYGRAQIAGIVYGGHAPSPKRRKKRGKKAPTRITQFDFRDRL